MLHLLMQRCSFAAGRLTTVHDTADRLTPPPALDLVVSHFFLDCLSQPEVDSLITRIALSTVDGALWLVSDFDVPRRPLTRALGRAYIRALYFAFRLTTGLRVTHLPDIVTPLTTAGFTRIARHERLGGLLYTELWCKDRANTSTPQRIHLSMAHEAQSDALPAQQPVAHAQSVADAQPDPEPAAPSLPAPDPAVFHHEVAAPTKGPESKA
jgi:hypothetical protein